jgi:polyhydroxyalkanoate synthesis regulator phasin
MIVDVSSDELIQALSNRIAEMVVDLETTRLALVKSQQAIVRLETDIRDLEDQLTTKGLGTFYAKEFSDD